MIELEFACTGATPDTAAATPSIALQMHITESTGARIHALALRCQLRIEPQRRRYGEHEAEAMLDLFGEPSRWGGTLKPLQLAFIGAMVPRFSGATDVVLALPCSYDFDVAANKYLYGLDDGEIPMLALFSGTVFTDGPGGLSVQPVPWHKETTYRMPVAVWKQTMALHFPGTAWLRLRAETHDALHRYRARQGMLSWDDAIERLLKEADR